MTEFVSRETFHPNPGKQGGAYIGPVRVPNVICHHTPGQEASTYDEALAQMRAIYRTHAISNGWADYGYNLVIWDRFVFEARGLGYVGAHAPGGNSISVGIAFLHDGRFRTPTAEERRSFNWAVAEAQKYGFLSLAPRVSGHRDWINTTCPGDLTYPMLDSLLLPPAPVPVPPITPSEVHVYDFNLRPVGVFEWGNAQAGVGHINYHDLGGACAYDFPICARDDVVVVSLIEPGPGLVCNIVYPSGKQSQAGEARWGRPAKFPVEEAGFATILVQAAGMGKVRVVGRSA